MKRIASMFELSEAEIIRRAIGRQTSAMPTRVRDLEAWERVKAFIASRMEAGAVSSTRRWRRGQIYEEQG